jgi:glucokinase
MPRRLDTTTTALTMSSSQTARISVPSPTMNIRDAASVLQGAPFLAMDVGGTNARLAIVQRKPDGTIGILDQQQYAGAGFDSLNDIAADFLSTRGPVDDIAIGCTGVLRDDKVMSNNLPWPVSLAELRSLGIARVAVVNDFVAVAHAVQCMSPDNSVLLSGPTVAMPGPTLVVGPGTGLGAAYRIPTGNRTAVLPSEAGQIALAPGNPRELAVLAKMMENRSHVSAEQITSGPGLLKLYRTLCALDGVPARQETPAAVTDAARAGETQALEAVLMFCDVLGSQLGDLALVGSATSVYIAGGIVSKMRDFMDRSRFHARFINKGVMRAALDQVPVWLIDYPHTGLVGAAAWYLEQSAA